MRILLVDDQVLFRAGLASLFDTQPDLTIVGQAASVSEAISCANTLQPDLILMDFGLPDGTGLDATRAILAQCPAVRIIFLTVHDEDERLFAALRAGAKGYLLKNTSVTDLLHYVRAAACDDAALAPSMVGRVIAEIARTPAARPTQTLTAALDLTEREVEVLHELAIGASNREIAERLVIAENTVRNHVRNILGKLRLQNRRQAGDFARDRRL